MAYKDRTAVALAVVAALYGGAVQAKPKDFEAEAARIKVAVEVCKQRGGLPLMAVTYNAVDRPPVYCFQAAAETRSARDPDFGASTVGRLMDVQDATNTPSRR